MVDMSMLEKRLEELDAECEKRLSELKDKLLKDAVMVLVRVKCISNDNWRYFLMVVFPPNDELSKYVPMLLLYHDSRCAYCGKPLVITKEPAECVICGRKSGEGKKIICVDGHYICDTCYSSKAMQPLKELMMEGILSRYYVIKEAVKESLKRGIYSDIKELEKRKTAIFREAVYLALREAVGELELKGVEVITLTNVFMINYLEVIKDFCLKVCDNKCPTIEELLKVLNSSE